LLPIDKLFFLGGNIGQARREEKKNNSYQTDLSDQEKPPLSAMCCPRSHGSTI
jgi:hypothetical protein